MLGLPMVRQHLDAPTLEVLLRMLMVAVSETGDSRYMGQLARQWESLRPAAESMASDVVLQLLQTAAHLSSSPCTEQLLRLPAAQQFSIEDVKLLLHTAVVHGEEHCFFSMLQELPAVEHLGTVTVEGLLQTAVQHGRYFCAYFLLGLPAAELLSTGEVLLLLQKALRKGADMPKHMAWHVCCLFNLVWRLLTEIFQIACGM